MLLLKLVNRMALPSRLGRIWWHLCLVIIPSGMKWKFLQERDGRQVSGHVKDYASFDSCQVELNSDVRLLAKLLHIWIPAQVFHLPMQKRTRHSKNLWIMNIPGVPSLDVMSVGDKGLHSFVKVVLLCATEMEILVSILLSFLRQGTDTDSIDHRLSVRSVIRVSVYNTWYGCLRGKNLLIKLSGNILEHIIMCFPRGCRSC